MRAGRQGSSPADPSTEGSDGAADLDETPDDDSTDDDGDVAPHEMTSWFRGSRRRRGDAHRGGGVGPSVASFDVTYE
ncbi:hypothetical protein DQF30_24015 [Shigella flexneri]|nr:hypothetical protein [Shigella flexneri]